jgi:hypothetical protein
LRAALFLVDLDISGALDKQPVAPGLNGCDLEMAILIRGSGVVAAFLLIFSDQFEDGFLERFSAGFLHYAALDRCLGRFFCGLNARGRHLGNERENAHDDDAQSHSRFLTAGRA